VERWSEETDPEKQHLAQQWRAILERQVQWKMACERTIHFGQGQSEAASIFSDAELVERRVRSRLPSSLQALALRADVARAYHVPASPSSARHNFVYEPATGQVRPLGEHEQLARMPASFALCRLYARDHAHDADLATALDRLLSASGGDRTNM
jgi:hypothetical protein